MEGDVKSGSLMAGQIAGLVKESMSCEELIRKVISEAEALLTGSADKFVCR